MTNPGFRGPDPFASGPPRPIGPIGHGIPEPAAPGPSGYPTMPAAVTARRPSPPLTVWLALVCVAIAAGLCLVQAAMGVRAAQQSTVDDAQVHYLGREVADLSTTAIVFTIVIAALFALAYLGFGYAVWRGEGWPTPLGTVLAALSLFGLMGGPVIIALVVAGVVAVVLFWLPPSREFARRNGTAQVAPVAYDPWGGR